MPVVEHVADHVVAGEGETEGSGGWHTEVVHCLAAQEFTDRGSEHGPPVRTSGIGGWPSTLELQVLMATVWSGDLGERDGSPIAELAGPVAELVPAVVGGKGAHARQHFVAAEDSGELVGGDIGRIETERLCDL